MIVFQIIYGIVCVLFFGLGIVFLNISKNQLDNAREMLEQAKLEKLRAQNILSQHSSWN